LRRSIFVTGATGFVGRHLIGLLDSPEIEVYGTSYPEEPDALDIVCQNDICHLDIRRKKHVLEVIKMAQPDWVFHLAAISNVGYSWKNREETLETNLTGTLHVFEGVKKYTPQAKVLFVSSADVYASESTEGKPLREDDQTKPSSPYAFTKIGGELLTRFYSEIEDMDIVISRAFPHTGPGQREAFVCSDWASQVARIEKGLAEPVIRVGNIEIKRDFTDVRDVVNGYVLLMEKGAKGEVYNIASGKAVSLSDVLGMLLSFSSEKIEIKVDPQRLRKADIPCLVGDTRKMHAETGWTPKIPLEQTLLDLLNSWRNNLARA
jgi:GDP-4-dehydro-6-deoxy-D-mannose reductase